jgi:predicted nucleic acid-binding protein
MRETFVDTSYWLAVLNPRDAYHKLAIQIPRPPRMVTTRGIQIEVMDALSSPRLRRLAVRFWQRTNSDPHLEIVGIENSLLSRAGSLFQKRPDKDWSFTDCISFVVMEERKITAALSNDRHFEQAGFQCLLRKPSQDV